MSPTAAMLIRCRVPVASGVGADCCSLSSAGRGRSVGVAVHALSTKKTSHQGVRRRYLVTESNAQHIDLGRTQPAAQHIELIEVIGRANVHPMKVAVVHLDTLNMRFDAL